MESIKGTIKTKGEIKKTSNNKFSIGFQLEGGNQWHTWFFESQKELEHIVKDINVGDSVEIQRTMSRDGKYSNIDDILHIDKNSVPPLEHKGDSNDAIMRQAAMKCVSWIVAGKLLPCETKIMENLSNGMVEYFKTGKFPENKQ